MKCKSCKNDIPEGSIFCMFCGNQILRSRKKEGLRIPKPRQLPSGAWRIELRAEGQSGTFKTKAEAEAWAKGIRADFIEIKNKPSAKTLRTAIDDYINSKSNVLSASTIGGYRQIQKNRFQSVMDKRICDITNWQKIVNKELEDVSVKSVKNAFGLISAIYHANNCELESVSFPKVIKQEHLFLDLEQIPIFMEAIRDKPLELPALLALNGLRRSEILAIDLPASYDIKNNVIKVRGAMVPDDKGKLIFQESNKTELSRRDVPIMIPRLTELLQSAPSGKVIRCYQNTLWRQINSACDSCGLPLVGVHGLRHSFASLCYELNISEIQVQKWGGWSKAKTVHEIYTHLSEANQNRAANAVKAFFSHDLRTNF